MEEIKQTIIRNVRSYQDYPFEAIDESVLALFQKIRLELVNKNSLNCFQRFLRLMECFLQVTNKRLATSSISHRSFVIIYRGFIGAIYSEKFSDMSLERRYFLVHTLVDIMAVLSNREPSLRSLNLIPGINLHTYSVSAEVESCRIEFENMPLVEEKVWLWRGWHSTNRDGRTINFPLYPIYRRLGREFTQRLYLVCEDYFSARKSQSVPCLKPLVQFIEKYPGTLSSNDFQQPGFVSRFWREFFAFYVTTGYAYGNGARVSTLITMWRNNFLHFVQSHLIPSGLFAEPWGVLPSPEPRQVKGARTHIKTTHDGHEIKTKLLTHIPLHVTDAEAMHLLFEQIQADVDLFLNWAEWAADDIWRRYRRRFDLAPRGQIRKVQESHYSNGGQWLTARANPEHLQNAAATFAHHGFLTRHDARHFQRLYPISLSQTAEDLALPTTDALLPHCIILIANHPAITPSFLERIELFNKNGKQTGYQLTDSGPQLVSHKDRRGHRFAQQIISLTSRTAEVVQQVIALTQPLRDYLKARNDDNWRYLFLTSGRGMSYPRRLSITTWERGRIKELAKSLGNSCHLSMEERHERAIKFSLPALRSSSAVLTYLRTCSVEKMAMALGHAKYDYKLIARYLPEPILGFFQERWVRIFQTGIIVEALKDSDYLLPATEFESMDDLDAFLRKHALKVIPKHLEDPNPASNSTDSRDFQTEVVFGVNTGILTILISLQLAVNEATLQVNAKANYWAGICHRLVAYLDSELVDRNDLQGILLAARRNADPNLMRDLIYAQ